MKKAKLIKDNKKRQNQIEKESYSIKNLILIILILVVIFGIFYYITTLVVKPIEKDNTSNTITEFDSTKITLNNLLDRKESEYYVLATKESLYTDLKINYTEIYNSYINDYSSLETALPFYTVNLDDALNKNYIGDKLNISNDISKLELNNEVLFKVKNGEIEEHFVGNSDIIEVLSDLKES